MLNKQTNKKILLSWQVVWVIFLLQFSGFVVAVSAEYSQSYGSDEKLYFGSLVSLDPSSSKVILANAGNSKYFLGVYIADSGSTLAVNKSELENQVAVSGKTVALVSDINGPINKGDLLAVSAVSGVATRATDTDQVVGFANASFDDSNSKNTKTEVLLSDGSRKTAFFGPIEINLFKTQQDSIKNQNLFDKLEQSIGKPISAIKIVMVVLLSITLIGVVGAMSYSAIRTSIIQSSRNPLAQPVIMQSLAKVIFIIVLTTIIGVGLIYLVIRI